jgi:glycosyltransferase involved in cell wall biosynthesis
LRIAIFTETFLPKVDGIVVKVTRLLDHLEKRGHQAVVFGPSGSPERYRGFPVVSYRSVSVPFYPELSIAPPWARAAEEIRQFQPDVIHLVNPISLGLAGLRVADRFGIPVLASYHTDVPGFAEHWHLGFLSGSIYRYARWIHNRVEMNVCPSNFTRSQLLEHGFQRVNLWRGGVDIEQFNPAKRSTSWRERLTGGEPGRPLVLYIGRVSPEKRIDRLFPLLKEIPQARLAIVGDGPSRANLEGKFAGTDTIFTGYLKGEELAAAYAAGDLFVFTGDKETFGNVVVEAMASGLPVIAPNSGGVTDLVLDGYNGLLYDPAVPTGLVGATKTLLGSPKLLRQFGTRGRSLAEQRTWEITLDELLGHYQTVLETGRRRSGISRIPRQMIEPIKNNFKDFFLDEQS